MSGFLPPHSKPLVSITGALSSLREETPTLDQEGRRSLIETAYEEAERLNRLVGNLLNMTRLEAGAIHLRRHGRLLGRATRWHSHIEMLIGTTI